MPAAFEKDRNRAIVDQFYVHVLLEYAGCHRHFQVTELLDKPLVERTGRFRRSRIAESGTSPLLRIRHQRELADHKRASTNVPHREIELEILPGEDPQFGNSPREIRRILCAVLPANAQQHHQATVYAAYYRPVYGNAARGYALQQCFHTQYAILGRALSGVNAKDNTARRIESHARNHYNAATVLSISESVFHKVSRPARYTGSEWNSVVKSWDSTAIRFALCYPDTYEVGMSNLALHVLYEKLNSLPDVLAERVFAPWTDMEQELRERGQCLFSLETRHPLWQFDIIAFSLGYELTYTNVLTVLDLGGVPVLGRDRTERHPLVIAGGSCAANPEPMADFVDLFFIGEAEEGLEELVDAIREHKGERSRLLKVAAQVPGVYVPSLYAPVYDRDGAYVSLEPLDGDIPRVVSRRTLQALPPPPTRPVVSLLEIVHDYGSIEIQRGCTRGCRFCQAGMLYRPVRSRSREQIVQACEQMADNCGYSEMSLLSLSSSDYPHMETLIEDLGPLCQRRNISLSLPSLRLGPESVRMLEALPGRRGSSFTFAPEAGTERLRRAINKNVSEDDIFTTLEALREGGWTKLKLYFMIGLPTETEEDVVGIASLVRRIAAFDSRLRLNVSVSLLVPKPHTPCQWHAQDSPEQVDSKVAILKRGMRTDRVRLSWPDVRISQIEAALSRGDRRAGQAILRAWQMGSRFDAWGERFLYKNWLAAFESCGLSLASYLNRASGNDTVLPWSHISTGVSDDYLAAEQHRMHTGDVTTDCREANCNACGLQDHEGGCMIATRWT